MKAMRRVSVWIGLLLVVGLLVAGLHSLLSLRMSSGDIYPDYSSYRAGPLGTKILYRALQDLPDLQVERLIKNWDSSAVGTDTAVLMLGSDPSIFRAFHDDWSLFLHSGGRIMVALSPGETESVWRNKPAEDEETDDKASSDPDEESDVDEAESEPSDTQHDPAPELAGLKIATQTTNDLATLSKDFLAVSDQGGEPVPWMGSRFFEELGPEWTVLYRFNGNPVVIERSWGRGSLVLLSDSYLFSNEAMVLDRHTPVLAAWLGSVHRVIFDERHLGVMSQDSIMMLVARYRLRGVLVALLVLASLFVWQRTSSFIPRYVDTVGEDHTVGAWVGSGEGFTNLLMRYIPRKEILQAMVEEWENTFRNDPTMKAKARKLRETYNQLKNEEGKVQPVEQHNRLVEALNERK